MGLFHGQGFRYLFRVADLSDYSPPTSNRQSLFQCVAERARSISYHYPWRFRHGYRYPLGTLAPDCSHYYGDNSRMVFPVEYFCYPLARMDAFNTLTSAAYIFLMFLSSMFYPLSELPGWFQTVARVNPMTWQVDMLRFSLLGTGAPTVMLLEGAAFVAFSLVGLAFAVRALDDAA